MRRDTRESLRGIIFLEADIRRYQDRLVCSGYGVIALSLWSVVRMAMFKILDPFGLEKYLGYDSKLLGDIIDANTYNTILYILIIFALIIDLFIRTYIGKSAIREGKGKKTKRIYLVIAVFYIFITYVAFPSAALPYITNETYRFNVISPFAVELTADISLIMIVHSSIKLRKLTK